MQPNLLEVIRPSSEILFELLKRHQMVKVVDFENSPLCEFPIDPILCWRHGTRIRSIYLADEFVKAGFRIDPLSFEMPFGLIELMDNNPLVCANKAVIPGEVASLALMALGPLIKAGLILTTPAIMTNQCCDELEIALALESLGWAEGAVVHFEPIKDSSAYFAIAAIAEIELTESIESIQELFEEHYDRQVFVKSNHESDWDAKLVEDSPVAIYRVSLEKGETNHLVKVLVLASSNFRGNSARAIHCFNVMCGFEEHLPF